MYIHNIYRPILYVYTVYIYNEINICTYCICMVYLINKCIYYLYYNMFIKLGLFV